MRFATSRATLFRVTLFILGGLALANCGQGGKTLSPKNDPIERAFRSPSVVDWDTPLPKGERVQSVADTRDKAEFAVRPPRGLGQPVSVFVSPADERSGRSKLVGFVYDTDAYGRVIAIEGISETTDAHYEVYLASAIASNGKPGVRGRHEIVILESGRRALMSTAAAGYRTISWRENGIDFKVKGPNLTHAQCVAIAQNL